MVTTRKSIPYLSMTERYRYVLVCVGSNIGWIEGGYIISGVDRGDLMQGSQAAVRLHSTASSNRIQEYGNM